jgi:hypothetical protein
MKDFLKYVTVRNYLNFGEYYFSPIMEASNGIALEYCKKVQNDNHSNPPLFFCFPEKKGASLWTSISILTNYFLEDYIDNVVGGINLKRGYKVKIFDSIAEVEKIENGKVYLKFKDQGGIPIKASLKTQISIVNSQRSLSLFKKYKTNLKEFKSSRNAISKILVPNDSDTINQHNLDSKVLLIAGRGNYLKIHNLLKETIIYGEPLSSIFPEKKNLVISPDLKKYKDLFNSDKENELNKFKDALKKFEELVELDVKSKLIELNMALGNEESISLEFEAQFLSFLEDYKSEIPKLKFLESLYPGYQDSIPENLRAVVINDICQINDYPNTINGFLKKRIPVIFISDRHIDNNYEIDFFKELFTLNPEFYRLNWNRQKIIALNECSQNVRFIDFELWRQSIRYSKQQIKIIVSPKNELDSFIPKLLKQIRNLDSFEILQKAFFNMFYPALFALKNSNASNIKAQELIIEFEKVFNEIKSKGLPKEIIQDFEKAIHFASNFDVNTKNYNSENNIYSNFLNTSIHERFNIPLEKKEVNIPTSNTNNILFTGYPYNEFTGKYLLNSICRDFIPNVTILCWPNESSLTMSYLRRRLKSSYFSDFLFHTIPIKNEVLLKNENDFESEIDLFLNINSPIPVEITQEANLEYLHKFKYSGYKNKKECDTVFNVKCNILNFEDGSFMFLPKRSSLLAEVEDNRGEIIIREVHFNELHIGSKIFKYKKDRRTYREISKNAKKIKDCFEKLEKWKDALELIYNDLDKNLDSLEKLLNQTKTKYNLSEGNPIKSSIQRWLFDDEIICPRASNLKIILLASNLEENEKHLMEMINAYKLVSSYTIGLSAKIKKNIVHQISSKTSKFDTFFVNIDGNNIPIETRTIASLDNNEILIDYHNTRKILC